MLTVTSLRIALKHNYIQRSEFRANKIFRAYVDGFKLLPTAQQHLIFFLPYFNIY